MRLSTLLKVPWLLLRLCRLIPHDFRLAAARALYHLLARLVQAISGAVVPFLLAESRQVCIELVLLQVQAHDFLRHFLVDRVPELILGFSLAGAHAHFQVFGTLLKLALNYETASR